MKTYRIAVLAAAAALLAVPARPQTAGELLQKGIYNQDTAGDLEGAITIYRQIVSSGNSPRDVAAQAQYRLAQSLIEKGDLANGATEFSNLARNYADYGKLIASLAAQASKSVAGVPGRKAVNDIVEAETLRAEIDALKAVIVTREGSSTQQGETQAKLAQLAKLQMAQQSALGALTFDSNSPVAIKGIVFKLQILKPNSFIGVDPQDGSGERYTFALSGPTSRNLARMGDQVTVTGALATGGQRMPDGTIAAIATTITNANGEKTYDRGTVMP